MPSDLVAAQVLAIVAEQTGYPTDMLDLDLDLEADLGIDTVKQAETFAAIRAAFDIPRRDDLNLRDYHTLEKVIAFVHDMPPRPRRLRRHRRPPSPQSPSRQSRRRSRRRSPRRVLAIVAEQTGYPADMLDLDLDLEADLGIDTVKQAETFAAIRAAFDIPRRDDLNLRDYHTLEKVIGFVHDMRPDLAGAAPAAALPDPAVAEQSAPAAPAPPVAPLADADRLPRRVPAAVLRPRAGTVQTHGRHPGQQSRVVVALDDGGVGRALVQPPGKTGRGGPGCSSAQEAGGRCPRSSTAWLADGPDPGRLLAAGARRGAAAAGNDLPTWREANRHRIKNLSVTMRVLYDAVSAPGTFLISAARAWAACTATTRPARPIRSAAPSAASARPTGGSAATCSSKWWISPPAARRRRWPIC